MPGVSRSKACDTCKKRKVKCDEKWPTCSPCARHKVICPGPSSPGFKFVHQENQPAQRRPVERERKPRVPGEREDPGSLALQVRKMRSAVHGDGSSYGSFRLVNPTPRPQPTTLCDRVAQRLVGHLERGRDGGITLQMTYLKYLPQRLSESACLRDSVALFCTSWAGFRRQQPRGEIVNTVGYGKVLRSLQRALEGPQALSVETLAAVTLLERTDAIFNRKPKHHWDVHQKGIRNLITQKGPPNVDDMLDVCLANENYGMLLGHLARAGGSNFMLQPPWKEVMEKCEDVYLKSLNLEPFSDESIRLINRVYAEWPDWVAEKVRIRQDPLSDEMMAAAASFREKLSSIEDTVRGVVIPLTEDGLASGTIAETKESKAFVGKKYLFKSDSLAQMFMSALMLRALLLLMIRQLDNLYARVDEVVCAEYRNVSIQIWMFETYLRAMEPLIAVNFMGGIHVSLDAASVEEKERIVDWVMDIDESLHTLGLEKSVLAGYIQKYTDIMTGEQTMPK